MRTWGTTTEGLATTATNNREMDVLGPVTFFFFTPFPFEQKS